MLGIPTVNDGSKTRFAPPCRPVTAPLDNGPGVISSVVERFVHIEDVRGSNPLSPTNRAPHRGCRQGLGWKMIPQSQPHRSPSGQADLIVIRHGETEWNRAGRMQGALDSPLTDRGRDQAIAIGALLGELGVTRNSHVFFTSPQTRAAETARLALSPLELTATPDPLLREIEVGDWTGLTREEIEARWPSPDPEETFLNFYLRAPGGEGFGALWDRVGAFLSRIERPAILFTHGVTSRFLRTRAMGYSPERLDELPGGQGVLHRLRRGHHETLRP